MLSVFCGTASVQPQNIDDFEFSQGDTIRMIVTYDAQLYKMSAQVFHVETGNIVADVEAFYWPPLAPTTELFFIGTLDIAGQNQANSIVIFGADIKPLTLEDAGTAYPDVDEAVEKIVTRVGTLEAFSSDMKYEGTRAFG